MKKLCLVFLIILSGCSSSKPVVTDITVFQHHPKPYKIFGVGNWKPGYSVYTLIDANSDYFVIIAKSNAVLHKGDIYNPTY